MTDTEGGGSDSESSSSSHTSGSTAEDSGAIDRETLSQTGIEGGSQIISQFESPQLAGLDGGLYDNVFGGGVGGGGEGAGAGSGISTGLETPSSLYGFPTTQTTQRPAIANEEGDVNCDHTGICYDGTSY